MLEKWFVVGLSMKEFNEEKAQIKINMKIADELDWESEFVSSESELPVQFEENGYMLIGYDFDGIINSFELINHNGAIDFDQTVAISTINPILSLII